MWKVPFALSGNIFTAGEMFGEPLYSYHTWNKNANHDPRLVLMLEENKCQKSWKSWNTTSRLKYCSYS